MQNTHTHKHTHDEAPARRRLRPFTCDHLLVFFAPAAAAGLSSRAHKYAYKQRPLFGGGGGGGGGGGAGWSTGRRLRGGAIKQSRATRPRTSLFISDV